MKGRRNQENQFIQSRKEVVLKASNDAEPPKEKEAVTDDSTESILSRLFLPLTLYLVALRVKKIPVPFIIESYT